MADEHHNLNAHLGEYEQVTKTRQFVERSDVKAWAALSVGASSLCGLVFQDLAYMKVVAGVLGTVLPIVFLVSHYFGQNRLLDAFDELNTLVARRREGTKRKDGG